MFSLLSILIHIINSIFSGVYTSQFLKCKQNKKITIFFYDSGGYIRGDTESLSI